MKRTTIKKPTLSPRKAKLIFYDDILSMKNLETNGEKVYSSKIFDGQNIFIPQGKKAKQIFNLDGTVYLYLDDLRLYKLDENNTLNLVTNTLFGGKMRLVKVDYLGDKKLLVISENKKVMIGNEEQSVDIPYGDYVAIYKGMLITASKREINFSKEYDYANFSTDINKGGKILLDDFGSDVCGLNVLNDRLFVFLKDKILEFTPFGEFTDFTIKTIKTPYLNVQENTVRGWAQKVYFVSDNRLYSFDGQSVLKVKSFIDNGGINVSGQAYVFDDLYMITVTAKNESQKSIYSVNANGNIHAICDSPTIVSESGGMGVNGETGEIVKLKNTTKQIEYTLKSKKFDFGDLDVKRLFMFNLYSKNKSRLKIKGSFGECSYLLLSGYNLIRCLRESQEFSFEVVGNASEVEFYGFNFIYAKRRD